MTSDLLLSDTVQGTSGVLVRSGAPEDAAGYAAMMSEPSLIEGTLCPPLRPEAEAKAHFLSQLEDRSLTVLTATITATGDYAGYGCLRLVAQPRRRHVGEIVAVGVREQFRRHGVGAALMRTLVGLADEWLQLHRLELEVNVDNAGAIALYERFGFQVEATKRGDCFRDGQYIDGHVMGRLCR